MRQAPRAVSKPSEPGRRATAAIGAKRTSVREMILLGQWRGEAAIFPVPASEAELAEAAIVQAAESGRSLWRRSDSANTR
jgi:hypothetical protein